MGNPGHIFALTAGDEDFAVAQESRRMRVSRMVHAPSWGKGPGGWIEDFGGGCDKRTNPGKTDKAPRKEHLSIAEKCGGMHLANGAHAARREKLVGCGTIELCVG